MASDQMYLFSALASFNPAVQNQLRQATSPERIVELASDHGYKITTQQLQYFASRLHRDHWAWANQGVSRHE